MLVTSGRGNLRRNHARTERGMRKQDASQCLYKDLLRLSLTKVVRGAGPAAYRADAARDGHYKADLGVFSEDVALSRWRQLHNWTRR